MYFDFLTMACMADELGNSVVGGRVQQVLLVDAHSVGLEIYAQRQRRYLLASAHPELSRVHLSSEKLRRGVDRETGLLHRLRKLARGAALTSIEQPAYERILRLELEHPEWGCSEMVIEIMGRHSNIILLDDKGRILDSVKRVPPHMSSVRPVLPGQPYTAPPPQEKLPPSDLTEYRLFQLLGGGEGKTQVWQALVRGVRGMSPLLAREISYRALGRPRAKSYEVEQLAPLLESIHELLAPLTTGQWSPTVVVDAGRPAVYAPYPITHRGEASPTDTMSQAVEAYVAATASPSRPAPSGGQGAGGPGGESAGPGGSDVAQATVDGYAAARSAVRKAISAARNRAERRHQAVTRDLLKAADAEKWRKWGEWVLAYAYSIEPGQTELVAETGESEVLVIPLDPAKTPADNAQALFSRYRKAQRAAKGGPGRLRKVELLLRDLDQLEADLDLAADRTEIDAVRAALIEAGHLRQKSKKPLRSSPGKPLTQTSPDGLIILIGRNSRQNDTVTFRRAQPGDWWFHTRGVPGAHVIVRSGSGELPEGTIRRAAELAAYFSPHRGEPDALVDYTLRRRVRRIPGAAPGLVTYSHERTIRVPPRGPD